MGQNDRWMIQAMVLEDQVADPKEGWVVRGTIVDPRMEQEVRVGHPLPPDQIHHPTQIGQLGLSGGLQGDREGDPRESRAALHPAVELQEDLEVPQAVQGVSRAAREGLLEGRAVKPPEGPAQLHPSGEPRGNQGVPQAAQEGLRGDRAVKPEGPVAMRRESHWAEAQEVRRMHPEEERTQAGLER